MSTDPKTPAKKEASCADCPMRKKAEANPKALLSRLWKWHTGWCPGWKAYQARLAEQAHLAEQARLAEQTRLAQ